MSADPKHIDAVARVLMGGGDPCEGSVSDAASILDSTDSAVRAAMLDALIRHGVLTEERRRKHDGYGGMVDGASVWRESTVERRLVTSWEVMK